MSDTAPRHEPSFNALPSGLKKKIVSFLQDIDEEEQNQDDDCGSCCGGDEAHGEGAHAHKHEGGKGLESLNDLEKAIDGEDHAEPSNVSNLSLTNKEWHGICASFLWQSPDIAERSLESLIHFRRNLLPKYAEHVESLFIMQNFDEITEEEDSSFKVVDGASEEERVKNVFGEVEKMAAVQLHKNGSTRKTQARSLVLAEIVNASPKLVKVEFDCVETEEEEEDAASESNLKDYVFEAVKARASTSNTISHLGYSLTPLSTSTYEDVAALLSSYSSTLRSLRLDCNSAKGDSQVLFDSLLSLERLESLDLADSDFVFDFAALKVSWPLRRLALGEFLALSAKGLSTLVNRFASTLTILELDGCPSTDAEDEEEEEALIEEFKSNPINLPRLQVLEIATNHDVKLLEWLTSSCSSLSELRIGFCPDFDVDETVAFLEKNRDTLQNLEVDVATFSYEEVAKLGSVCEELEIRLTLVSSGFDDDDFMGGEFGEEEDEEWEDEDASDDE